MQDDILTTIRERKMSGFQIRAVVVALAIIIMDGFDIAAMAFAAPALTKAWGIGPEQLGIILSASLFGMAVGAILFSPLGDRIGRRGLTNLSLTLVVVGMVVSVLSPDVGWLFVGRFVTGIGIGAMSQLNAYVSEYASASRRGFVVGIYATGFPIGATVAGFIAGAVVPALGWHSIFLVGAILSAVLLAIAVFFLPESLDFLLVRQPRNALERINHILAKIGVVALAELPSPTADGSKVRGPVAEIFTPIVIARTLLLWLGYGCLIASYYFATSWVPQLITTSSGDAALGTSMGIVLNIGGIIGCVLFGFVTLKVRVRPILITSLALAAVAFLVFGLSFGNVPISIALAAGIGLLTTGSVAGFYAVTPGIYKANARATGAGWMVGIGRLVSIVSPILAGFLLAGGTAPQIVFMMFAVPLVIGAAAIFVINAIMKRAGIIDTFTAATPVAVTTASAIAAAAPSQS